MGMFDTIILSGRRLQTKALGASNNTFAAGDAASVLYKSQTEREYTLNRVHRYVDLPAAYTIEARAQDNDDVIFVMIVDGRIAAAVPEPLPTHFDRRGHSIGPERHKPLMLRNEDWVQQQAQAHGAVERILQRRSEHHA
ncbi:hypothetical protein [Mycobacteroides abscessus]|uniref:hypothetical protein n=1 Tax=Mycobacteroides abscessus TaxID=36809 RepID=UPI0009A758B8|nr:hypothetical protein [Mycobacteroides abscessus]SLH41521.1 Uncharacterised protein [Mycobacteroides abscessus subsp. massiliense]